VSLPVRITTLLIALVAVVAGGVYLVVHYIGGSPPWVDYSPQASGGQVNIMLQEDAQNTVTNEPDWVSYFIQDPKTKAWVHTTMFKVPANTQVNVTILGYDGCTPARNNVWSQVQGTIGGVMQVDGKSMSQLDTWAACNVGHTFSIPGLGLNVPMATPADPNANLCSTSPCTSGPHKTITFAFRTPAHGGIFRWQCKIPCGGGFIDGFGGPMETLGYMMGEMQVTT
jgi:hypothetical protein